MPKLNEKQLMTARQEFNSFLAVGEKDFPKLKMKTALSFFQSKGNTSFESLGCVGYNPAFKELTATVKIKRATGYSGSLCSNGSLEYVRFYLDYQDGSGWQDMGFTALNVHDIPTKKDCSQKNEKPIDYVVRLKINPKRLHCTKANLPKVRAILSWNSIPAANDPNQTIGTYIWSDTKDETIQIAPFKFIFPILPILPNVSVLPIPSIGDLIETATLNPNASLANIADTFPDGKNLLNTAKNEIVPKKVDFLELADIYKKAKIEPHRFGYKLLKEAEATTSGAILKNITNLFASKKLSVVDSLSILNKQECNTKYEELECVGADYNQEALVGTLRVKKASGYSGDLCKKGSKEYVSFWIQNDSTCKWKHAGTTFVEVHDIKEIPADGLTYSVVLPHDFSKYKKKCTRPQVLKVRAILSWNTPPTGMNCSNWGNVVESYIQIKPRIVVFGNRPKLITVGGIATNNINNSTGLTVPGAKFEFNQTPTFNNSPFAGRIVVQGVSAPYDGMTYKVKITNLATNGSYYLNDDLFVIGYSGGSVITTKVTANAANEYEYQPYTKNISSILARFSPGTNDKIRVTIEHANGTQDSQVIQMDSTMPKVTMSIDDGGNCTHYTKGDTIKGQFTVSDNYLENYAITIGALGTYNKISGLDQSGTNNGAGTFEIDTDANQNCGAIHLRAVQKTIWNSVTKGMHSDRHITVCLG